MNKVRIGAIVVVVLIAAGYKLFFVDSDEVGQFNDTLVEMVQKSDERFSPVGKQVEAYALGEKVNTTQMTQMQKKLVKLLNSDVKKLKSMTVPDCEVCKELHASCMTYMANSLAIAEGYTAVIKQMELKNPGTEDDLEAATAPLGELIEKDTKLLNEVVSKQQKMAKKYNLTLK